MPDGLRPPVIVNVSVKNVQQFKIKDSIYLISGDYELDLHNDYNFTGVDYSVAEHKVTLSWVRGDGDWIAQTAPAAVALEFRGVSHYQFLPRDPEKPFTEDDCLSSAGYWTDDDWRDGVFTTEEDPEQK